MDIAPQNWRRDAAKFQDFVDYLKHPDGYEISEPQEKSAFAKALRKRVGINLPGGFAFYSKIRLSDPNIIYEADFKNAENSRAYKVANGLQTYTIAPDFTFTLDDRLELSELGARRRDVNASPRMASAAVIPPARGPVPPPVKPDLRRKVAQAPAERPAVVVFMQLLYVDASRRACSRDVVLQNREEALTTALAEAQDFDNGIIGFRVGTRELQTRKARSGSRKSLGKSGKGHSQPKEARSEYGPPQFEPAVYFGRPQPIAAALTGAPHNPQLNALERDGHEYVVSAPVAGTTWYTPLRGANSVYTFKGQRVDYRL